MVYVACCAFVCPLTKLVTNCGGLSRLRWLANASRVAAAHTEAVGFSLGEIKQRKARRLYWDLCVHPLPAIRARDTLTNKEQRVRLSLSTEAQACSGFRCRLNVTFST